MLDIGKYHQLEVLRDTSVGLYLGNEAGDEVLLPNKYCPSEVEIGMQIEVFVYLDHSERIVATTLSPRILLHQFGLLQVSALSDYGAFLDWGLEKDLFVPFSEQRTRMALGEWHVVYMDIDTKTNRLYASSKIDKYLTDDVDDLEIGQRVDLLIAHRSELGYSAIINQKQKGLIFESDIFKNIDIGDEVDGYIKNIRPDNKVDVSLQPIGYRQFNDVNTQLLLSAIEKENGFLPLTDKSSPVEIYARLGISKKSFKKAVGALYKARMISIEDTGIRKLDRD